MEVISWLTMCLPLMGVFLPLATHLHLNSQYSIVLGIVGFVLCIVYFEFRLEHQKVHYVTKWLASKCASHFRQLSELEFQSVFRSQLHTSEWAGGIVGFLATLFISSIYGWVWAIVFIVFIQFISVALTMNKLQSNSILKVSGYVLKYLKSKDSSLISEAAAINSEIVKFIESCVREELKIQDNSSKLIGSQSGDETNADKLKQQFEDSQETVMEFAKLLEIHSSLKRSVSEYQKAYFDYVKFLILLGKLDTEKKNLIETTYCLLSNYSETTGEDIYSIAAEKATEGNFEDMKIITDSPEKTSKYAAEIRDWITECESKYKAL